MEIAECETGSGTEHQRDRNHTDGHEGIKHLDVDGLQHQDQCLKHPCTAKRNALCPFKKPHFLLFELFKYQRRVGASETKRIAQYGVHFCIHRLGCQVQGL